MLNESSSTNDVLMFNLVNGEENNESMSKCYYYGYCCSWKSESEVSFSIPNMFVRRRDYYWVNGYRQ